MPVKTHKHTKPIRIAMMESLGFSETRSVAQTTPAVASPTRLVSTTNTPARTVEELWNTTELQTDSLVDWKPLAPESRLDRRVRWQLVVIWLLIFAVVGTGGYWFWLNSTESSEAAFTEVETAAVAMERTLGPLAAVAESLQPGSADASGAVLSAVNDADTASRDLFTAAAALSSAQSSTRSSATDAATQALDASKNLAATSAYLGVVSPVLSAPTLITDPELIDLQTAATDFGSWRARYDMVVAGLPDGVLSTVTSELQSLGRELETIQGSYLDGLREDDRVAALAAVRELEGRLAETWAYLTEQTAIRKSAIIAEINRALEALSSLTR